MMVEPYNGSATFTGKRVLDGVTKRFVNAPLDDVLPSAMFESTVCRAAIG